MRRIGLVGPWHPHDAVDLLLVDHLAAAIGRDLGAELVVVVGRGRDQLPWPVATIGVDGLLGGGLDGLVLSGDLATSHDEVGVVPPDVWMVANGLAAAAGLPVAWYGVRLLGDEPLTGATDPRIESAADPLVIDDASARLLGARARLTDHPLAALAPSGTTDRPRSGRVIHASPSVLAARATMAGDRSGEHWLALRPGRGDRLVGLPDEAARSWWDDPAEVLDRFAGVTEVVTDDPAVAALAISQGAEPRSSSEGEDLAQGGDRLDATAAWADTVAQLQRQPEADGGPLRRAVRGRPAGPEVDVAPGTDPASPGGSQVPRRALEDARRTAREAKERADRWRDDYHRLRRRRAVRLALKLADLRTRLRRAGPAGVLRAVARLVRAKVRGRSTTASTTSTASAPASVPVAARADVAQVVASVETNDRTSGPAVSVLVLTRDGEHHLRRLLPALEATRYRSFEVIVVDNGSGEPTRRLLADWDPEFEVQILRNEHNASFGAGNDQAAAAASGEYLLLLNDDIEPIEPGWLGHLVTTAERTGAGAVGARLVYPVDTAQDNVGDSAAAALSLQHRGIHFENWGDGLPRARHLDARGDATASDACEVREVPASTAACLLIPRTIFDQVGGFTDGYDYGLEDVDFCLKLREAGHHIVVDGATALWHHEFGTQNVRGAEDKQQRREHNRQHLAGLWGPRLHREVLLDRLTGARRWSESPLHVAITVSRLDERRRHGDWYSAHELGRALEALGWRVTYVERYEDRWYDLPRDLDVLVVLIDTFDLGRVPDHLLTVAWVRNWTDRWVGRPWFDDFDVVFASSEVSVRIVRERSSHDPVLLPLATDPDRFRPAAAGADERCDVVFVGSYWGEDRPVAQVLAALAEDHEVRLYGRGWDQVPEVAHLHRGVVAYSRLPSVLASARIVLDDTASPTKPYEAVNTRVFDTLACGSLIVSDNPAGVAQRFTTELPTWTHPDDAVAAVRELLADDRRRSELIGSGRQEVLEHHSYGQRAERFRDTLLAWAGAPRLDVLSGVPDRRVEHRWGDTHFARAFQRQLRRRGVSTRLVRLPEWDSLGAATADAVVHLFGLSTYAPRPAQRSVLWNISHPELVTPERCEPYDLVMVASDGFASELREHVSVPVHVLHQASDPDRFRPQPAGPPHDLLFVGNSRKVRRRVIADLLPTELDLAIYGWGWTEDLVDLSHVRAEHVPNDRLGGYYAAAAIVLNDHWDDMREHAFVSNRLYDALAAGAFVISDHVDGIDELFDGGVVTYRDREELRELVTRYLADPWERERVAARGRAAVLARHTFAHRAEQLLRALAERDAPATVLGAPVRWPDAHVDS